MRDVTYDFNSDVCGDRRRRRQRDVNHFRGCGVDSGAMIGGDNDSLGGDYGTISGTGHRPVRSVTGNRDDGHVDHDDFLRGRPRDGIVSGHLVPHRAGSSRLRQQRVFYGSRRHRYRTRFVVGHTALCGGCFDVFAEPEPHENCDQHDRRERYRAALSHFDHEIPTESTKPTCNRVIEE